MRRRWSDPIRYLAKTAQLAPAAMNASLEATRKIFRVNNYIILVNVVIYCFE
jgi:hypothetical protein